MPELNRSTFHALNEFKNIEQKDWQTILEALFLFATAQPEAKHIWTEWDEAYQATIKAVGGEEVLYPLLDASHRQISRFWGLAYRLGFALARTWPENIDQFDVWFARAWEFADLSDYLATPWPSGQEG